MTVTTAKRNGKLPEKPVQRIEFHRVQPGRQKFRIVGTTPLLMDQIPEGCLDPKHAKKHTDQQAFQLAKYCTEDGRLYIKSAAIKSCLQGATRLMGNKNKYNKAKVKCSLFTTADKCFFAKHSEPRIRVDIGRTKNGDLIRKVRAEIVEWELEFEIEFDQLWSVSELFELLEKGGFGVGLGAWRPECGGDFGRFQILVG